MTVVRDEKTLADVDLAGSIRMAKRIGAFRKECFLNAYRGMRQTYWYVLGFAFVPQGQWWEDHAWIETRRGMIIDPTVTATKVRRADRREYQEVLRRNGLPLSTPLPGQVPFTRYRAARKFTKLAISALLGPKPTLSKAGVVAEIVLRSHQPQRES